jgi:hypothetical protein
MDSAATSCKPLHPARERQAPLSITPLSWMCFSSVMLNMWFVSLYVMGGSYYLFNYHWGVPSNNHVYPFFNGSPVLPVPKKPPNPLSKSSIHSPINACPGLSNNFLQVTEPDFFHLHCLPTADAYTAGTPMDDPAWVNACRYSEINPGAYFSSTSELSFKVIWDTGASEVITSDASDFINGYVKPVTPLRLRGVASGAMVEGIGLVEYCFRADDGSVLTVRMKAYYMPGALPPSIRLLPPQRLCNVVGGDFSITGTGAILRLPNKPTLTMELDPSSHLPCTQGTQSASVLAHGHAVNLCVTTADNQNLTTGQKLLLSWHFRFGHLSFKSTQWVIRSGIFGRTPLLSSAGKCEHPKCAACEYGKARRRPTKSSVTRSVPERENVLKTNVLFPGQRVSMDHFECSARGRLTNSLGKTPADQMYRGGAIFVDQSSGYVFIQPQVTFSSRETLQAKLNFERMCLSSGVMVNTYMSDNGVFNSNELNADIVSKNQDARYSGVGAHHHNGIAERAIQTISNMSRTMMLHAAVRWPDLADSSLWPLAMDYAAYTYNHMPSIESGMAPIDLFTKTTVPRQRLKDLHVWGCPTYVLEPKLQDGKKLPRWKPRSRRGVFLGLASRYASSVPLVLNPNTSHIFPQFHVIFDDLFTTVLSQSQEDEPPKEWEELCITSRYQSTFDDNDPIRLADEWLSSDELDLRKHQDAQTRIVPPQMLLESTPIISPAPNLPSTSPPLMQNTALPSSVHQREITEIQNSMATMSPQQTPDDSYMSTIAPVSIIAPVSPRPSRIRRRPTKFDNFDVKYGSLSTVEAFFSSLPDLLRDPSAQKEYELDTLESILHQACQPNELISLLAFVASKSDPDTLMYHEAMMAPDKDDFCEAMTVEISGLEKQQTWTVVPRSTAAALHKKVLPSTWTFKRKRYPDGRIRKYKARFCVRGDKQVVGEDVFETYAPVVQWSSVRLCFIMSVILGLSSRQVDYTNAFVQAKVKTPMFVELPKGFNSKTTDNILHLHKNLYGSRDAPLAWFDTLKSSLQARGFTASDVDPCLFIHKDMIVLCFVDDLIYIGRDVSKIDAMISDLGAEFILTVEEDISSFLGIQIDILPDQAMHLTQRGLTQRILNLCHMHDCNTKDTPASTTALGSDLNGAPFTHDFHYASAVGMLMYLASNSRPDIAFAVHQCARFTHSPRASHGEAIKRICRYLQRTLENGLILRPKSKLRLDVHVDSDFAGLWKREDDQNPVCVKSRTGFVISLADCPILWQSKLQGQVALSTMEAEYIALSTSLRSLLPLKELVREVASSLMSDPSFITTTYSSVFEDNNGALTLATVPRMTPRSKHIAVPYHFFREHVANGSLQILKIASENNKGDIFTKGLDRNKFHTLRFLLMGW